MAPLIIGGGVAILLTGQGLQVTLMPVRANLEGFSALAIGLMGTSHSIGFTFGCLRGSALVSRVGHVRVLAALIYLIFLGYILDRITRRVVL